MIKMLKRAHRRGIISKEYKAVPLVKRKQNVDYVMW